MLTPLHALINERNESSLASQLTRFADLYYSGAPSDEVLSRSVEDLYGATLSCWQFIQNRSAGEPKVRVFNPDHENHGWQSLHTVIEIVFDDMPFLVDSVRMQLNARQMSLHAIHYCVLHAGRDEKGQLKATGQWQKPGKGKTPEAIIYIEVDHHSDEQLMTDLAQEIEDVLSEVQRCVRDFPEMLEKAKNTAQELRDACTVNDKETCTEAAEFVDWMASNHFTFLAYDEFTVSDAKSGKVVDRDPTHDLGIFRNIDTTRSRVQLKELEPEIREFITGPSLINFMKSGNRSRIHRPAYPDYVVVKRFDKHGNVVGGMRFMGLFTSIVYIETPNNIPIIRRKLTAIREKSGFERSSHSAKELDRILEVYPRDELFQSDVDQLYKTAISVLNIQERRQTRVYLRKDTYSKFLSCIAYTPRDVYNTELRQKMEDILTKEFSPLDIEFNTYFSESVLARTHFIVRLNPEKELSYDEGVVANKIRQVVRSWTDDLHAALVEQVGEERGNVLYHEYRSAFPAGYREDFSARTAVADIQHMDTLKSAANGELGMSFYRELEGDQNELRFKLFNPDTILPLSDIIPVLENFGLRVMGEHPYEIVCGDSRRVWIHNFSLKYTLSDSINIAEVKQVFQDAFRAIWDGRAENDSFNRLVLGAKLGWKDIALLRAYARYMKQIRFGISENYIADTLSRYIPISAQIVNLFHVRFGLGEQSAEDRDQAVAEVESKIHEALDDVDQLNEDRAIRRYIELIKATLRTNYFQPDAEGKTKSYLSFKIKPSEITDIPLPRPMFEIFVYSPRIEGVHLRGGKVARGGLRWSDRVDDFRTEVLGLVKAQQVKNAVIVPVGAKGGFVSKCPPTEGGRDAFIAEGVACYQTFISALLDVTDNLIEGEIVPPESVVRHDEPDPYLVVAADKGTATFSDIANEIAVNRGFWMGDGFASGGSVGYDHKKMGITARGAWVSVQRHFRERGVNVQTDDFTVVGIGDMAGDVFGNGMLLSEHIQLVAAFNHMHIFIDPEPDSASSFKERKRLFELPRSSWEDYDKSLISKGGGVFLRSAKSIDITPEMKKRFGIKESKLAPNDLIKAALKAEVDLIWNGGIGTYIKASSELDSDVGDKANDALRINGKDVRAKVIGEGGNLGVTQLGRIEFGLNGGASYTDFIDNAGGVDCSDHEVNIKIMLNEIMDNGDLTRKQRNQVFLEQTDPVADLVLNNNYHQTQAIALAYRDCRERLDEYIRLMKDYEQQGKLNRSLEFLPDEEELQDRRNDNTGLTKPELAVLISYTKADMKERLNASKITSDDYISKILSTAFPDALNKKFSEAINNHRLRKEIIATQLANDMINHMGITFVNRLGDSTGASIVDIARAYVTARDTFSLHDHWREISALDYKVPTAVQENMMAELMRLVRRATRWFLRNRRVAVDIASEVERFGTAVQHIAHNLSSTLKGDALKRWQQEFDKRREQGVPETLAAFTAGAGELYSSLGIIEAAAQSDCPVERVTQAYFGVGDHLSLNWFLRQINDLPTSNHWEAMARESFRDDLDWQQRSLTVGILKGHSDETDLELAIEHWEKEQDILVERWGRMLEDLKSIEQTSFPMIAVALRELLDLAQASRHA
ncbi:NAD-glutamate dehydrogenase [Thalassolituus sp.]|uniref:NAD-glutamate dehydrogenase n=1 Tax=Thalassolituus sp. TaxID=2030822 RepID=UPI00243F17AF|nr:NAD-glutamate dehydrogenase [Thalassolituus sp.]